MHKIHNILLRIPSPLLSVVGTILLFVTTLIPEKSVPTIPIFPGADKIVHIIMFALLTWAYIFDLTRKSKRVSVSILIYVSVIMIIYAAGTEWLQGEMGYGRSADFNDFISDLAGISFIIISIADVGAWWTKKNI